MLSNFNGVELKPCICGNTDIIIEEDSTFGLYTCSIGCSDKKCEYIVDEIGYSKQNAMEKAVRAWNDR